MSTHDMRGGVFHIVDGKRVHEDDLTARQRAKIERVSASDVSPSEVLPATPAVTANV